MMNSRTVQAACSDAETRSFVRSRRTRRAGAPLLVAGMLAAMPSLALTLAGCGGPPDATGEWRGQVNFEERGQVVATDLELALDQSEDGSVTGSGEISIRAPGETEELDFEEVSGRVDEDGTLSLATKNDALLADKGLELRGTVGGDSMSGVARMSADDLLAEPVEAGGEFELERQE